MHLEKCNKKKKGKRKDPSNCDGYTLMERNSVEFVDGMSTNVSEEHTAFIFRVE
jgi:hypothetical protein